MAPPSTSTSYSSSDSDEDPNGSHPRFVHFNEQCILIPETAKSKKLRRSKSKSGLGIGVGTGTVGLSLPLPSFSLPSTLPWRWPISPSREHLRSEATNGGERRPNGGLRRSESVPIPSALRTEGVPAHQHVILKLPYPIIRKKSSSALLLTANDMPPPCLVRRRGNSNPLLSTRFATDANSSVRPPVPQRGSNNEREPFIRKLPKRSASLPAYPDEKDVEYVPLRQCCEQCFAACKPRLSLFPRTLPPLTESSREQSPAVSHAGSHIHLPGASPSTTMDPNSEEDWCAGLHFTKGALRLRRQASEEQSAKDGSTLLGHLLHVDEADSMKKRSSKCLSLPPAAFDRIKRSSPGLSPTSSEGPDEDLFPLPSPRRSPQASPMDSSTNLASSSTTSYVSANGNVKQSSPVESRPGRLEAAIKARIAECEAQKERERLALLGSDTESCGSRFKPHVEEIKYDPNLPDPDSLPPDSEFLRHDPYPGPVSVNAATVSTTSLIEEDNSRFGFNIRRRKSRSLSRSEGDERSENKMRRPSLSDFVRASGELLKGMGGGSVPPAMRMVA